MNYKQLVAPNLSTTDYSGWCLRFTGNSFNTIPRPFACATDAWNGARFKHTDALPNVAVPVFFTWTGTIGGVKKNWGDVAIWVPGRGVFGTPLAGAGKSNRWDASVQARAAAIGGGAVYLGWTEDLNTIRLAEPITQGGEMATAEQVKNIYRAVLWREADAGGLANYTGRDANTIVTEMLGSVERKNLETRFNGLQGQVDSLNSQLLTLSANTTALTAEIGRMKQEASANQAQLGELAKTITIKDNEINRLNGELATAGSDSINLNALGVALKWLLTRLGLKG